MADTAPKAAKVVPPGEKGGTKPPPKKPTGKPAGRPPALQKQLEEFFMMGGMMVAGTINRFDGEVLAENSAELAKAWNELAQKNATIKRILEGMMETSTWSTVLMTTAAVAIPIAQNHGAIPPGVPHPFRKPPQVEKAEQAQAAAQQKPPMRPPTVGPDLSGHSPITPSNARPQ